MTHLGDRARGGRVHGRAGPVPREARVDQLEQHPTVRVDGLRQPQAPGRRPVDHALHPPTSTDGLALREQTERAVHLRTRIPGSGSRGNLLAGAWNLHDARGPLCPLGVRGRRRRRRVPRSAVVAAVDVTDARRGALVTPTGFLQRGRGHRDEVGRTAQVAHRREVADPGVSAALQSMTTPSAERRPSRSSPLPHAEQVTVGI